MLIIIPTIDVFASLAGCQPEELVNFRILEDGSAVAIIPTGQKFTFSAQQLADKGAVLAELETQKPAAAGYPGINIVDTKAPGAIVKSVSKRKPKK